MSAAGTVSPVSLLQKRKDELLARFLAGDEPGFLERHAEIIDHYFQESFAGSTVGPRMGMDKNPHAIIALGGYGRKEQCLFSDVDVLLLFKKKIPEETKSLVKEIFYPLWDIGLDVSYVIRSLKECTVLASKDFEVLTALMDARFLCGISSLYSELVQRLRDRVLPGRGAAHAAWLAERILDRHEKFGDSTYLLEPNLKEGLGGLRDYHAMLWLGRTAYNINEPRDLEFLGHLSHDEFQSLEEALLFIRTVRNRLHHAAGRKCDQLYFQYQIELAGALGFKQTNGQQPVEAFLGALHGQMEFVKRHHLMFVNKVLDLKGKSRKRKALRKVVGPGIEEAHGALYFESPEIILKKPQLLIRIFEKSAALGLPLSMEAARLVREFLHLIDDGFRRSKKIITTFERILAAPPQAFNVLNEMLNTGALTAFIPEMKGVVNRIQYDEYHVYPVDKHLMRTVEILKRFREAGPGSEDALYQAVFNEIRNPNPLLWAALLHDVGKGVDEPDHAVQGARIVRRILDRMGFSARDIETILFLVRDHLFLIHTATRRDIHDEKVVIHCARRFKDVEHLKMLYLLTIADSKATGPKAWGEWRSSLTRELFLKILHILEKGELASQAASEVVEKKKKEVFEQAESPSREALERLFDSMTPRYLLYVPPHDIVRHIELHEKLGEEPCLLDVQVKKRSKYRTVTVCARDFPGLFSKIAGVFTLNNLDILSAQIYTWRDHVAVDIFRVKAPPDSFREDEVWGRVREHLKSALSGELALGPALTKKVKAYRSVRKPMPGQPDRIEVSNDASDFFTIVEVYTHDYPGLLYRVTDALFRCKLDIWVAMIGTKADQVVDVFYVRDFDGQKIDDPKKVNAVKEAVGAVLSNGI